MYIDKRTLNPFFKKTNSTPKDLLDWVEFLMKNYSFTSLPCCHEGGKYLGKYDIYSGYNAMKDLSSNSITLEHIKYIGNDSGCQKLWKKYVWGEKQPLLDAIKEFKVKYNL